MSRIDISVTERATDELVTNRGFCRSSHLSFYGFDSPDPRVQAFAGELSLGIDVSRDKFSALSSTLRYVIAHLEGIDTDRRTTIFANYTSQSYARFLADLRTGLEYLIQLSDDGTLDTHKVEII